MSAENRVRFFVRLPEQLKRQVQNVAQRNGRSASKEVQKILESHVEKCGDTRSRDAELVGLAR
jgi:predicted DNA-binding protein